VQQSIQSPFPPLRTGLKELHVGGSVPVLVDDTLGSPEVDEADLQLRNLTYELFVELGRAPTAEEAGLAAGRDVREAWRRLHDAHALVLDSAGEVRMANPFSAVPTPHRVSARGRWWYANCAWDALGICAALGEDGRIETTCLDCGEELAFDVRDGQSSEEGLVFHCLVPAGQWWDDIVYT
jgi:hypothetical protein